MDAKTKTIMVVDDSEVDRGTLSSVLKKHHFNVVLVEGGEKCIEQVGKSKPDVILLDTVMPNVDGNEVLRQLRAKYNAIELPILMVTIKSGSSDIVESLSLGANDYITKPVDFDVAIMRVNTQLKISELSQNLSKLKELEAVNAMIATYNHEINNPLSVALGALRRLEGFGPAEDYEKIERALWRITSIVKAIKDVAKKGQLEFNAYTDKSKIIKID